MPIDTVQRREFLHHQVDGEGPPVIMVHGISQAMTDWHALTPELVTAGFSAIAVDLLGHGDSPKPEEAEYYTMRTVYGTFESWVEALTLPGRGKLTLTGKLGEVMRESADIAYSYVMAHLKHFHADPKFFDEALVHLHVPEGATPKDGPSAGITMATALLSLARNEKLQRPLAMTGELTLTGQVLPVGGIREKVIAARRVGIRELVLPEANRKDFDELPDYLREGLSVHFAKRYDDVFKAVFKENRVVH